MAKAGNARAILCPIIIHPLRRVQTALFTAGFAIRD